MADAITRHDWQIIKCPPARARGRREELELLTTPRFIARGS
jgi:hypothetical protein